MAHPSDTAPCVAAYERAFRRQIEILKTMGANAIRTTHNPPSEEMIKACDELGMFVIDETFDVWRGYKIGNNSYARWQEDWWPRDLMRHVRRDRNHPSVVMWSIGNEVIEQKYPELGVLIGQAMTAMVRLEDPTRPTTMGNWRESTLTNGIAAATDVFGCNYLPYQYGEFYRANPGKGMVGAETESQVSTRGAYFFPEGVDFGKFVPYTTNGFVNGQVSSHDIFTLRKNNSGESSQVIKAFPQCTAFVGRALIIFGELAVGFDSRSSYYGILDLCGFPKDRFFCYQAEWRPDLPMVHALPHWTWPGREGKKTPVHVYTSGDAAEVFINGRSLGVKRKCDDWRLMWNDVVYEPGELKVIAYKNGAKWAETAHRTAGVAARLEVKRDRARLFACRVSYVEIRLAGREGRDVPELNVIGVHGLRAVETAGSPTRSDGSHRSPIDASATFHASVWRWFAHARALRCR